MIVVEVNSSRETIQNSHCLRGYTYHEAVVIMSGVMCVGRKCHVQYSSTHAVTLAIFTSVLVPGGHGIFQVVVNDSH